MRVRIVVPNDNVKRRIRLAEHSIHRHCGDVVATHRCILRADLVVVFGIGNAERLARLIVR